MSKLTPAAGLDPKVRQELLDLADCGSSEAFAVADCLNTIAENGAEMAETANLGACAEELVDWALRFLRNLDYGVSEEFDAKLLKFLLHARESREGRKYVEARVKFVAQDVQSSFDVSTSDAEHFMHNNRRKIEDRLSEVGNEMISILGDMDKLKRLDEEADAEDNEPPQDVRVEG